MRFQGALLPAASLILMVCPPSPAQSVSPAPETGATPSTLLLYRADLLPGKEAAYAQTEAEIARGYANAKIPVYWLALQSVTSSSHVLYFDGFDSFSAVEQAGADVAQGLGAHPEIAALQQKLQGYASGAQTVLAFRRDDLGYRLNKIDLSKARFARVSILPYFNSGRATKRSLRMQCAPEPGFMKPTTLTRRG